MFSKVLVANRGEIAVRVARTCRELGVGVVVVHSDEDAHARHVRLADEAVRLPGAAPAQTYLNVEAIIEAALQTGSQAIHPGYGFLSERADVAEAVASSGLTWIGPPPGATRAAGDKVHARRLAESVRVPVVPGTGEPVGDPSAVVAFGSEHGYPVAIKAAGGGGGRGLKVVSGPDDAARAFESAVREAEAYFGYGDVYLERYLLGPKHIEVQIISPSPGEAMWLGARDCSLQRRHQKLIEETPPPAFPDRVPAMGEAAVRVADACGYVNAGTVEFLVDQDGRFYFLEINARLQVEHTITEEVLGLDLVAAQLRIASGDPLGFTADDLSPGGSRAPRGHAIECRINAEDPGRGFAPQPGRLRCYREPGGPGVRVDSGFGEGDRISDAYDSLIAKLVVWGGSREEARRRMLRALGEFEIEGVPTTIPAHRILLRHSSFIDGTYSTRTVEEGALDSLAPTPAPGSAEGTVLRVGGSPVRLWNPGMAAAAPGSRRDSRPAGGDVVVAPMHGTILSVLARVGDRLEPGDAVAILEAMKMETHVASTAPGVIKAMNVEPGAVVEAGEVIAELGSVDTMPP
jgi:acetyl-CoA/propionyl-CoA carboxylase, biotin carboxylase, biotin carboxyl carrier protein